MPDCRHAFRDMALCVLNVDVSRHDRRVTYELSAEQTIHIPFPDRSGPGGRKSRGVAAGAVDAQEGSAGLHPRFEGGALLLAESVSAGVIPNDQFEFRELVRIHDRP